MVVVAPAATVKVVAAAEGAGRAVLTVSDESFSYNSYPRFRFINLLKKSK